MSQVRAIIESLLFVSEVPLSLAKIKSILSMYTHVEITEALELNAFEEAVVSSVLTKYTQQRIELQILQLPKDKAREAYEKIAENQERELKQGLPPEKFEAFMELAENGFKAKKKKKKKKKKT